MGKPFLVLSWLNALERRPDHISGKKEDVEV